MESPLSDLLLAWYQTHQRALPWRDHPDPYAIWVSEVMLQQTRVDTVIPYFERWVARFPTLADLAAASQQEVLAAWEGLGYYRRARNLHRAARIVMAEYGGRLPADVAALRRLPGIGRYTAAAIASIAFGADRPALDGNIRRVYARLFDVRLVVGTAAAERRFWELAEQHLPTGRAGDFNQALMDLGALVCTPQSPVCGRCPLQGVCAAARLGVQEERPLRRREAVSPHHIVTAGVISQNGQVLIARRPEEGLLGGLWEFPGGKLEAGEDLATCLQRELREELGVDVAVQGSLGVYRHAYTHFRITLHAFACTITGGEPRPIQAENLCWVGLEELAQYPMGKVDRLIARRLVTKAGGTLGEGA